MCLEEYRIRRSKCRKRKDEVDRHVGARGPLYNACGVVDPMSSMLIWAYLSRYSNPNQYSN